MKKMISMLAVAAGFLAARPEAATDYYRVQGNLCYSTTQGMSGQYAQHGIGNSSSTQAMYLACPVTIPEKNYTEGTLNFTGYDRSGNDNISCTMNWTDNTGNAYSFVTSNTTGSDNYNVKFGNTVRVSPVGAQKIMWVSCRLPPTYNGGWMSVLTGIYVWLNY